MKPKQITAFKLDLEDIIREDIAVAIELSKKHIKEEPKCANGYLIKGIIKRIQSEQHEYSGHCLDDINEAINFLEKANSFNQENPEILLQLSISYFERCYIKKTNGLDEYSKDHKKAKYYRRLYNNKLKNFN